MAFVKVSPLTFRVGRRCITHFSIKCLRTVAVGGASWTWTFRRTSSFPGASTGWPCKSLIRVQPQHQLFDHFCSFLSVLFVSLSPSDTQEHMTRANVQNSICMLPDAFSSICCIHPFLFSALCFCVYVNGFLCLCQRVPVILYEQN